MPDSRQRTDLLRTVMPEVWREIRNLRSLVNSVLNGAATTGASAIITFAQNAKLQFLDQSYLVFNDGTSDQVRIGRLADSSIGVDIGAGIRLLATGSASLGAAGTPITQIRVYSPNLSPGSVPAQSISRQAFSVTGLATSDKVVVNPPSSSGNVALSAARVSATDTLELSFVNPSGGALTPTSGVHTVLAVRS